MIDELPYRRQANKAQLIHWLFYFLMNVNCFARDTQLLYIRIDLNDSAKSLLHFHVIVRQWFIWRHGCKFTGDVFNERNAQHTWSKHKANDRFDINTNAKNVNGLSEHSMKIPKRSSPIESPLLTQIKDVEIFVG